MTTYLNPIFYPRPNILSEAESIFSPWIASKQNAKLILPVSIQTDDDATNSTNTNIIPVSDYAPDLVPNLTPVSPQKTEDNVSPDTSQKTPIYQKFASPSMNRDSLFWCYYYHIYDKKTIGIELRSEQAFMNVAMNEKIKIGEFLDKNSGLLKKTNYKITHSQINEIRCDLMVKPVLHGDLYHLPFVVMNHLIVYLIPGTDKARAYKQFYSLCDEPDEDESNVLFLKYCRNERGKPQYCIDYLSADEKRKKRQELKQSWLDVTKLGSIGSKKKEELVDFWTRIYPNSDPLPPKITKQELTTMIEPIYRLFL